MLITYIIINFAQLELDVLISYLCPNRGRPSPQIDEVLRLDNNYMYVAIINNFIDATD